MDQQPHSSFVSIGGAIIIAGALIAIAIIWVKKPIPVVEQKDDTEINTQVEIRPISSTDHILGNPNAKVKIVEYSDTACPYCKMFNETMVQIMDEYGPKGEVAWIYRHFPLDKPDQTGYIKHKNAGNEAQALECASSLGGNDKFWQYEKALYNITPSVTSETPEGLDQKLLPEIAKQIGLDAVSFNECMTSGQFKDKVEADYLDGINIGVSGTPYSIVITPSGTQIPLMGAQPYQAIKTAIDTIQ
ncbi:MAG: thioredoxin domain-containing protein [Candidatus Paceibacterota bacterium]|jgi:protein-disulfide isomerase